MFYFGKGSKVLLYGAASMGLKVYPKLIQEGAEVCGFIDKRASEIERLFDVPVLHPDKVSEDISNLDDVVVFVAVKNVYDHSEIVEKLIARGFHNIVYKPYSVLCGNGTEREKRIADAFDVVTEAGRLPEGDVPRTDGNGDVTLIDYGVIEEQEETVVASIPVEFIYTNRSEPDNGNMWADINITALFPHLFFFRLMSGDSAGNSDDYLNEFCCYFAKQQEGVKITEAWKQNVLRNRAMVFEQMKLFLQIDPAFFARNAATAKWNADRGYFNLTSGKHRCSFLVTQKHRLIPLKVAKSDYVAFCNEDRVKEYLSPKGKSVNAPIPNPYFYREPGLHREVYYNLLEHYSVHLARKVYYDCGKIDFSRLRMLFVMDDDNMLARHFQRMGAGVDVYGDASGADSEILDALLHVKGIYGKEPKMEQCYDVVFWDRVKCGEFDKERANYSIDKLVVLDKLSDGEQLEEGAIVFKGISDEGKVCVFETTC